MKESCKKNKCLHYNNEYGLNCMYSDYDYNTNKVSAITQKCLTKKQNYFQKTVKRKDYIII